MNQGTNMASATHWQRLDKGAFQGEHAECSSAKFEISVHESEQDRDSNLHQIELQKQAKWENLEIFWLYSKYILISATLIVFLALFVLYGVPYVLEKLVIPLMAWESRELSKPALAMFSVLSLAILPALLLPTGPIMWLIGFIFGYGLGFLLMMIGCFFGMTIPYILGHRFLHDRVQKWLTKHPKNAALLKLADNGGWLHQFRVVFLLRLGPFPYAFLNYAITATHIMYGPYITASFVPLVPEAFLAIYVGRLIRTLADFHQQRHRRMTPVEIAYEVVGLVVAVAVTVLGMVYGKKALKELEREEEAERESKKLIEISHGAQRSPMAPLREDATLSVGIKNDNAGVSRNSERKKTGDLNDLTDVASIKNVGKSKEFELSVMGCENVSEPMHRKIEE